MKLSKNGLNQIVKREGVFLHAYYDTVGVITIGTGHTSAAGPPHVVPGMVITKAENDKILLRDLAPIEKQVNETIKVPISQNQYDALVSIIFNVGPRFLTSTCVKRLNTGDYRGAAEAIMLWNKPPEIIGRRGTEKKQFMTPDPKTTSTTIDAGMGAVVGAGVGATALTHSYLWLIPVVAGIAIYGLYRYLKYKKEKDVEVVKGQV